jgi:CPA2 family monovalent cation:H+ antiporter-2
MLLAAGDVPDFLPEVVALVGGAALIGYLSSRLHVVPIVGFLLAGIVIGPGQLGLIDEQEVVDAAAEVGVILLLFTIGLEFSLERLARIRRLIVIGGGLQVVLATGVTAAIAAAAGVPAGPAIFTGFLVALSSTAIVMKVLADRNETSTARGQASLGVLIFQDLAVVAMVLLVPVLAGSDGGLVGIAVALLTAIALVAAVLVVARRLMVPFLDAVARTCSQEVFLLAVVAICFGTALLSAAVGASVSLGAFLAGLIVSESRHGTHAFGEVLPLQILFSATFFVSVGLLLDLGFLADEPLLVAAAVLGTVVIKAATGTIALRLSGLATSAAAGIGLLLAQVGEFSFVLDVLGRDEGLTPLDLGADGSQTLVATTVILMAATPALAAAGNAVDDRLGRRAALHRPVAAEPPARRHQRDGHVLVLGYGAAARALVGELREIGVPFTVVTLSPDGAIEASADGIDVVVGDYAKKAVALEAGVAVARAVVVPDDELERTRRVIALARVLNPDAPIIARPLGAPAVAELAEAGADYVVTPDRASDIGLAIAVRSVLVGGEGPVPPSTIVRFDPEPSGTCPHVDAIEPVQPSAYGCEDCLRRGSTWVHLRICLTCGHVGCCDSSPYRDARVHADRDQHPIAASLEPGKAWAYCYLDDTMMYRRTAGVA